MHRILLHTITVCALVIAFSPIVSFAQINPYGLLREIYENPQEWKKLEDQYGWTTPKKDKSHNQPSPEQQRREEMARQIREASGAKARALKSVDLLYRAFEKLDSAVTHAKQDAPAHAYEQLRRDLDALLPQLRHVHDMAYKVDGSADSILAFAEVYARYHEKATHYSKDLFDKALHGYH